MSNPVVLVLAAKRLTRLVTTDWIGEWMLIRPAKKWAHKHEGTCDVHLPQTEWGDQLVDPSKGLWRSKAVSGLDCDWCVGVWVGALLTVPLPKPLDRARNLVMPVLAVSQVVGMLVQLEHLAASRAEETTFELTDDQT